MTNNVARRTVLFIASVAREMLRTRNNPAS
jgi:hypothetical protein